MSVLVCIVVLFDKGFLSGDHEDHECHRRNLLLYGISTKLDFVHFGELRNGVFSAFEGFGLFFMPPFSG